MANRNRRDPVGQGRDVQDRLESLERRLGRSSSASVSTPTAAGVIAPFAGVAAPSGWLLCDGSAVGRAVFPELFAAVGTTYGAGDGGTTFNLPDLRGRVAVGRDASQAEFDTLGEKGGAKTHTLTIAQIPSHDHEQRVTTGSGGPAVRNDYTGDGTGQVYTQGIPTGPTGGGQAHNNLQPYLVANHIISTGRSSAPLPPVVPDPPLPARLVNFTSDASNQITAPAATWENVVGSAGLSFGVLERALAVRAVFSAQTATTAGQAYSMIGVGISGGVSLQPEYDQGGLQKFAYTPFTNAGSTGPLFGEKPFTIPAGTSVDFRLWQRRNTTNGITQVSYGRLEIIPERWM